MPHLVIQNGKIATNADGSIFMATTVQLQECCCDACAQLRDAIYERQRNIMVPSPLDPSLGYTLAQLITAANGLISDGAGMWLLEWPDMSDYPVVWDRSTTYFGLLGSGAQYEVETCADLLAAVVLLQSSTLFEVMDGSGGEGFGSMWAGEGYAAAIQQCKDSWYTNNDHVPVGYVGVYTMGSSIGNSSYAEGQAACPNFYTNNAGTYTGRTVNVYVNAEAPRVGKVNIFDTQGCNVEEGVFSLFGSVLLEAGEANTAELPKYDGSPGCPNAFPDEPDYYATFRGWLSNKMVTVFHWHFVY